MLAYEYCGESWVVAKVHIPVEPFSVPTGHSPIQCTFHVYPKRRVLLWLYLLTTRLNYALKAN